MKFGKVLRLQAGLSWNKAYKDFFVDYKSLKKYIKSSKADASCSKDALTREFKEKLDLEFEKVKACYLKKLAIIEEELGKVDLEKDSEAKRIIRTSKQNLVRLTSFVKLNCLALRKIAKKFDKNIPSDKASCSTSVFIDVKASELLQQCVAKEDDFYSRINAALFASASLNEAAEENLEELEIQEELPVYDDLDIDGLPVGQISRMHIAMVPNELGRRIEIPVIVAKGKMSGPVLGITSALHGNELNGIPLISRLFKSLNVEELRGTLVGIPVLNPPGYSRRQRYFHDGVDLNRVFPGRADGNCSQAYCHAILEKIIKCFDYHIDLHTASFGRVNSLYTRANMNNPVTHHMALLQNAQIIVHNTAPKGSMRNATMAMNIPSITVEIGNPLTFHEPYIKTALKGVELTMDWLNMSPYKDHDDPDPDPLIKETTICSRSYWIFSQHGGMLKVIPPVNTWVSKGEKLATVKNLFGDTVKVYRCPQDGIVVGKSKNPICSSGDRILHLGICGDAFGQFANDGH